MYRFIQTQSREVWELLRDIQTYNMQRVQWRGTQKGFAGIPGPQGRCPSNATTRPYLIGKQDLLALDSIPLGLPSRLRLRNHSESFTCPREGQAGHTPSAWT